MLSESTLRRRARNKGLRLVKLSWRSRFYGQYGPYMLVNTHTNGVVFWGLSLEGVQYEVV